VAGACLGSFNSASWRLPTPRIAPATFKSYTPTRPRARGSSQYRLTERGRALGLE
jgi:hypothetical protein